MAADVSPFVWEQLGGLGAVVDSPQRKTLCWCETSLKGKRARNSDQRSRGAVAFSRLLLLLLLLPSACSTLQRHSVVVSRGHL